MVNEGAGEVFEYGGRRIYGVCVAEKGVFRFTLSTHRQSGPRVDPADRRQRAHQARSGARCAGRRPRHTRALAEPDAFLAALGIDGSDLSAALAEVEAMDPLIAVLLEPMLGVTMAPTMVSASEKINVIPSQARLKVDCRVPPGLGERTMRWRESARPSARTAASTSSSTRRWWAAARRSKPL